MRKICFIILTISSILGILSCNSIVRKTTAKVGKSAAKEITENSSKELAEAVSKRCGTTDECAVRIVDQGRDGDGEERELGCGI